MSIEEEQIKALAERLSEASKAATEASNAMSLVAGKLRAMNDMMKRMAKR